MAVNGVGNARHEITQIVISGNQTRLNRPMPADTLLEAAQKASGRLSKQGFCAVKTPAKDARPWTMNIDAEHCIRPVTEPVVGFPHDAHIAEENVDRCLIGIWRPER